MTNQEYSARSPPTLDEQQLDPSNRSILLANATALKFAQHTFQSTSILQDFSFPDLDVENHAEQPPQDPPQSLPLPRAVLKATSANDPFPNHHFPCPDPNCNRTFSAQYKLKCLPSSLLPSATPLTSKATTSATTPSRSNVAPAIKASGQQKI
jgi:hypothetical protein